MTKDNSWQKAGVILAIIVSVIALISSLSMSARYKDIQGKLMLQSQMMQTKTTSTATTPTTKMSPMMSWNTTGELPEGIWTDGQRKCLTGYMNTHDTHTPESYNTSWAGAQSQCLDSSTN